MQRVELVLGLVVLALWIYSLVSCILTPESQVRAVPKALWLIVIVLLPLLGSVLWLGVGRERGVPRVPRVRTVGGSAAVPAPRGYSALTGDERIRRMEEDLARLERESGTIAPKPDVARPTQQAPATGEDTARPDRG